MGLKGTMSTSQLNPEVNFDNPSILDGSKQNINIQLNSMQ